MSWQTQLQALGNLQADHSLASRTTLGVGGCAEWLFRPASQENMIKAMALIPAALDIFPLGRGSNLLITDDGINGLVLDLSDLDSLSVEGLTLNAAAGVRMSKIAQTAANAALSGLEFMATVPGDLGGGVAMNAGAFGQQVSDVLHSIVILTRQGEVETITREALQMEYRYTALPKSALILSAVFRLEAADTEQVRANMREMRQKRSQTQPLALPNCGSVFKNPQGDFAARLIEGVGLKGKQHGQARISEVHANFIVNQGGASAEDVLALMRLAKTEVKAKTGIELEPEVRLVGCSL